MNPSEKISDWSQRTKQFYVDVRGELRKVSWPARQEVFGTTVVVVVAVFFFGFYLGLVDYILANAVARVFSYFGVGSPGGV
jgi:preprotein translocase subunit SecE